MAITLAQAEHNLRAYYAQYTHYTDAQIRGEINSFRFGVDISREVQANYEHRVKSFIFSFHFDHKLPSSAEAFEEFFPLFLDRYIESINPTEFVHALMPAASAQTSAAMVDAITNKALGIADLMLGWVTMGSPVRAGLGAEQILKGLADTGYYQPSTPLPDDGEIVLPPIVLPEVSLNLPISDDHADLLTAVYVAAFLRAPEHDGLNYWAGDLANALTHLPDADAVKKVAASMYFSGAAHGEAGTDLDNSAYVHHLYQGVLGRQAEASGHAYWTQYLDAGGSRSEFIAVFLASALAAQGDSDYVLARVAVARYAAQASVSGKGAAPIDLVAVLDGVTDTASAHAAIVTMQAGVKPAWPDVIDSFLWDELGEPIEWIEMASVSSAAALEVIGAATDPEAYLLG
ncbi:DUF4214 domain-containing protein [Achromobacter sp. GG226]|uniref:DUF4214 domain-containing protein n=1 Tax=Verticiella alkaliphila TaxID=2779529 RepID=UPI001C0C451D|nr:DUF4214 domain-containing protein [Verticiella sp. GG226]MBU4610473.1 DUF4214 domain-containing protein [Verticiella sp. GG226]